VHFEPIIPSLRRRVRCIQSHRDGRAIVRGAEADKKEREREREQQRERERDEEEKRYK